MDGDKEMIHLALTADIIPTRRLHTPGVDTAAVYGLLSKADVTIGNFEIALVEGGTPLEKLMNIKADPAIARDLPGIGLDIVTVANNHSVDYGVEGLLATRKLVEISGVSVVGAGRNLAEAAQPFIVENGGMHIAVIAFSCLTPTGMAAAADRAGIAAIRIETAYEIDPWYQMEEPGDPSVVKIRTRAREADLVFATEAVRQAKSVCDLLVASIHWGFGSGETLAEYQWPLAKALIEAGADVVHGHHPHAIHAVGFYRGRPVLFGLGTFIGQQVFLPASDAAKALWQEMSPDGYVARLTVGRHGVAAIEAFPTTLNSERLPTLAKGDIFKGIAERLARLSKPFGAAVSVEGDRLVFQPDCTECPIDKKDSPKNNQRNEHDHFQEISSKPNTASRCSCRNCDNAGACTTLNA
ncbi:CapA family protein [Mesorhizobium sp. CGMCC 1.15528]|uniref:CapA family protein n=1 Tax=Mesorhizobium zhangyense TaxID=1776730 RepID=A0A7C9RB76_9HYPH|nr:CapA family protein [Mesorhizobium zhangyense]NGN44535.1 CapA family protein [Mesorhizobium zhangyense]